MLNLSSLNNIGSYSVNNFNTNNVSFKSAHIAEANKKFIIDSFKSGMNFKEIASAVGCYRKTVSDALTRWGIYDKLPVNRGNLKKQETIYKGITSQNKQTIIDLYNKGCSYSYIAKEIGCDRTSISDALIKWGLYIKRTNAGPQYPSFHDYPKYGFNFYKNGLLSENIDRNILNSENKLVDKKIVNLYLDEGLSITQIADKTGDDKHYVLKSLQNAGIL